MSELFDKAVEEVVKDHVPFAGNSEIMTFIDEEFDCDGVSISLDVTHGTYDHSNATYVTAKAFVLVHHEFTPEALHSLIDENGEIELGVLSATILGGGKGVSASNLFHMSDIESDEMVNAVYAVLDEQDDKQFDRGVIVEADLLEDDYLEKGFAFIDELRVAPEFRGCGVGSRLLQEFAQLAIAYTDIVVVNAYPLGSSCEGAGMRTVTSVSVDVEEIKAVRQFYLNQGMIEIEGDYESRMMASPYRILRELPEFKSDADMTNKARILALDVALKHLVEEFDPEYSISLTDDEWQNLHIPQVRKRLSDRLNMACQYINPEAHKLLANKDGEVSPEDLLKHREQFNPEGMLRLPKVEVIEKLDAIANASSMPSPMPG